MYLPGNTYNPASTSNTPSIAVSYAYNGLNQLRSKTVGTVYTRAFAYRQLDAQQDRRSGQVAIMNYRSGAGNVIYGDRYFYDGNARLIKVASDTNATRATYGYTNGQLTSATVGGTSYTYTYDGAGNLLSKTDGGTRHSYTYGSSAWADLLTAYDGQSITYDEIGNPKSYYNGTRTTMTWAKGRQLATLTKGSTSVSYAYDMAGVRSGKTVGGTSYKFTTLSGLVTRQTWGSNAIDFVYDEAGQPFAMQYNGTVYYYVLNAQGDVIGIINGSGSFVASYTYDPWAR